MRVNIICNFQPLSQPLFLFKLRLFSCLVNNLSFKICSVSLTSRSIIIMGRYIIMITNWEERERKTRGSEREAAFPGQPWDDMQNERNICWISHLSRTSLLQSGDNLFIWQYEERKMHIICANETEAPGTSAQSERIVNHLVRFVAGD